MAQNLQIWSVSLAPDGSFGSDARMEVQVPPAPGSTEISKIAFDDRGDMVLAERAAPTGDYELMALAQAGIGRVLRYLPAPGTPGAPGGWRSAPDRYAIGFPGQYTNADGGVAIGYGYDANGHLDRASCGGFVWSTGEQLRNAADPSLAALLAANGSLHVNGMQGNAIDLVEPANVPPRLTYFIDYAAPLDDPAARGHMGDIAIPRTCGQGFLIQGLAWPPELFRPPAIPPSSYCPAGRMTFDRPLLSGVSARGQRPLHLSGRVAAGTERPMRLQCRHLAATGFPMLPGRNVARQRRPMSVTVPQRRD